MQTHTQFFAFFAAALVFLPLAFLVFRVLRGTPARLKCVLAVVFLSSLAFFCSRHHQDLYRGLDNVMYANIAKAFRGGTQAVRADTFFSSIPEKAASAFLVQKTKNWRRRSHDKAFVISPDGLSRPWFMLMHPLVASSLPEGLFVPLLGAVWLSLLFLVCCRGGGVPGIGVFLVLVFATPYPMWFFRDDYAEVAGSMLVATALLSHSAKPLAHPAEFALAAFLAGLASAFHRSTLLLALPVALLLFAEAGTWRNRIAVAAGFGVGLLALFLETKYVSAPYGDWTRIAPAAPHKAAGSVAAVASSPNAASPKPTDYAACFALGLKPSLASLGVLAPPLFLAGWLAVFRGKRAGLARKAFPFLLLGALGACICRLGQDAYVGNIVGVWNFRRIFPFVIACISLFAMPLSALAAGILGKTCAPRRGNALAIASAAILGSLCIAKNPVAYFAVDGKGCRGIAAAVGRELERLEPDLVVFDYFLHHLPFAFDGRFAALGVGEQSHDAWGPAEEWLAAVARTQCVAVVSSWTPPPAEKDLLFSHVRRFDFEYEGVLSKSFWDAAIAKRKMANTVMLAQCREGNAAETERDGIPFPLPFDGGPIGLRGRWKAAPRGGMWSRPAAAFVGPLPRADHPVEAVVETSWTPPEGAPATREVAIACPGSRAAFTVGEGRSTNTLLFVRKDAMPNGAETGNGGFGEYRVSVKPLFDPAQHGIDGFPKDLGIVFHSVTMKPL